MVEVPDHDVPAGLDGPVLVAGRWDAEGRPDRSTVRLLAVATVLASELGTDVQGVSLQGVSRPGVDVGSAVAPAPEAAPALPIALAGWAQRHRVPAVLLASGVDSEDIVARCAARLGAVAALDCCAVERRDAALVVRRPVHGGAFEATLALVPGDRLVASIDVHARQGTPAERLAPADVAVSPLELDATTGATAADAGASGSGVDPARGVRVLARHGVQDGVALPQAQRIVSGGRGMGGPEGFAVLSRLAEVLDAQLGASRPPCDAGWVPGHHQVGITGARVAPELYVAVGISGSVQHLAGMRASQRIVAINRDPSAPIFGYADLGVVGDWQEVVAGMLEELVPAEAIGGAHR